MYFMSRADTIKREYAAEGIPVEGEGMPDDLQAWYVMQWLSALI
jgi:hypothetical protein